jgi:hypothetical protein
MTDVALNLRFQYAFPLQPYVTFANSVANHSGAQWTTNSLAHETTLANASFRTIILPNVDTLYSEALLDLSGADVVATMPAMEEGRFFVWPFYDLFVPTIFTCVQVD